MKKRGLMTDAVDFESEATTSPDEMTLADLTKRCEVLDALTQKKEDLEAKVKILSEEIINLSMTELPELFQAIGLTELKLQNGRKLTMVPFYSAKIPEENKDAAFTWLEEHEHDGIIKAKVEMTFGKGEEEKKEEAKVVAMLDKLGIPFEHVRSIHPQTLKAFVREMVESGAQFPLETFGAFVGKVVKVK